MTRTVVDHGVHAGQLRVRARYRRWRPVVVAGDDFTLRGGSADASIKGKPKMSEQIAAEFRMPIIRLIEGSGGGGSVKTIETTGRANLPGGLSETTSFDLVANNMGTVPVVALGLGSVAGLGRRGWLPAITR